MPLNTTYVLRHIQHQFDQNIENVYFFDHVSGDGVSTDLALAFEGEWLPLIQAMQVPSVVTDGIAVYNMGDLGDFANLPLLSAGLYPDPNPLPAFSAVGFTLKLNTRAVRPGSKRIAGVSEAATDGDTIVVSGMLAAMEAFRLALQSDLTSGGDTWNHVVVKRTKTAIAGTTPTQYRYGLPNIGDPFVSGRVVAALTNKDVTSQVSRKK